MNETPRSVTSAPPVHPARIDGQAVLAEDGTVLPLRCPSDGRVFAAIPRCGARDVDRAVAAARRALCGAWGERPPVERGRILARWSRLVADASERLAALEAEDTGKPLPQARADMVALARYLEFYAGAVDKLHGETLPFLPGHTAFTLREPHGVTAHIIPWNYPVQIFGRSVGAALACGNACVVKPAEDACLSVLAVAALGEEAGLPAGALNIVTGLGHEAGAALAGHPGIDFISFTGSTATGAAVQAAAAVHAVGCALELGGKSAQILFGDADLERALPIVVGAITQNAGQTCSAGSRLLVEQRAWDRVIPALVERFAAVRIGRHRDGDVAMGAVINARQRERILAMVARARADGLPVLAEVTPPAHLPPGGFHVPAVAFGPVPPEHPIAQEEIFGPILAVIPFADEAEAAAIANGTRYGLVAGVWTAEGSRALRLARRLQAGQVFINSYGAGGGIELPFGGVKQSGHGREKGFEALYAFTAAKTVVVHHG